jgi:hypothetical protein
MRLSRSLVPIGSQVGADVDRIIRRYQLPYSVYSLTSHLRRPEKMIEHPSGLYCDNEIGCMA